jgi:hypothetical protein
VAIEFPWRSSIPGWFTAPDRKAEAKMPLEEWPICTTMGTMGSEADWAQLDPDFAAGKKALVAEDWNGAIMALKLAALRDPRNADIQNYVGYAYRRLRQLGPAMQHYSRLHQSPPPQRPEHLGELCWCSVTRNRRQLATLGDCPDPRGGTSDKRDRGQYAGSTLKVPAARPACKSTNTAARYVCGKNAYLLLIRSSASVCAHASVGTTSLRRIVRMSITSMSPGSPIAT